MTLVAGLPSGGHVSRTIAFGPDNRLYVAIGSSCNVCDDPTPRSAVTSFNLDGSNPHTFATGLRNSVGLAFNPTNGELWANKNDRDGLGEIGVEPNVGRQVERLASLAVKCGLRGLVCSPLEIAGLRQIIPADMQLVTPGIRLPEAKKDDQKRTLSPKEAIHAGANWLVIGRPICAAEHPRAAAGKILASLQEP